MTLLTRCLGAIALTLAFPPAASAQDAPNTTRVRAQPRFSVEAGAGLQIDYTGDMQLVAVGFAPTRSLSLLLTAERSHIKDEITTYADGFSFARGGTSRFLSGELRYAFFSTKRVSPYALAGWGGGTYRQNVSELAPSSRTQDVSVFYFGPGLRVAAHRTIDLVVDGRLTTQMITTGVNRAEMGVWMPLRVGLAWRF